MSWMKRAPGGAPPPAAEQPPLGAPQSYGNQQNMYSNYQSTSNSNQNPQQQYWQMQQQQPQEHYNQQHGPVYQQQGYATNANQYYQQPIQYNQNFPNQNFSNTQQGYPQNYYANQAAPTQNYSQNKVNSDAWEDNWDWGWEDSSKQKSVANQATPHLNASQTLVSNNANIIEESFVATNTWSWAMEDKNKHLEQSSHDLPVTQQNDTITAQPPVQTAAAESDTIPKSESIIQSTISNPPGLPSEVVKTLNDKEVVKEQLPNLALGKRFHLENLTPQWSIESQMSQESSDGPQNHSEGTYRSENQSRNSNKSSPGFNADNTNFNFSQTQIEEMYPQSTEWSQISNEDSTVIESHKTSSSRRESHDELSSSMQDISISNAENVISDGTRTDNEYEQNLPECLPPLSASPAEFLQPVSSNLSSASVPSQPPPSAVSTAILPSLGVQSTSAPPPTNFPPPSSSQNPFKHAGPFSHKTISKTHSNVSSQPFSHQIANSNLTSPPVVNKISQHNRMPVGFGANLETTPDNSERPDLPQTANFRPIPVSQQIPDNLEVAPQNDRNEYLQTEHLSSVDYGENTDFSRNVPPPGLRRMVVGQQETEYSQTLNISSDEPPPGLARMVPGQQTESDVYNQSSDNYMDRHVDGQPTDNNVRPFRQADGQQTPDYTQPPSSRGSDRRPIGLDRMVPGESSNNEYMQYQGTKYGGSNETRVVTGVDHDYPLHADAGPSDIREQNVDGSDYSETARNPARNIVVSREPGNDSSVEYGAAPEEQQREVTMEGENLQDLSIISGAEMTFSREQMFDVVSGNINDIGKDRGHDGSDTVEYPGDGSRRQSSNRTNRTNTSGEDSEPDRTFKSSPRRDRDKHKPSRDRDRDRDKEGRYSRGDRKYERDPDRRSGRDGRRSEKDRRDRDRRDRDRDISPDSRRRVRDRDRDISPDSRRHRRSTRSRRYETEDTDCCSDRERERRRYREGSYASKPPRAEDKEPRHGERRRYATAERGDRYEEEGGGRRRGDRQRDRYERRYRDIDPTRTYGNLRREEEERRRGENYSSGSRAGSREAAATATDEDAPESERRRRDRERRARTDRADRTDHDPYYLAGYGSSYGDPFLLQRQQYSYYERLRRTDPAAYMRLYKQLLAAPHKMYAVGYGSLAYEARADDRGSLHSGRSSANGLKGNDTYYGCRLEAGSLRDAPSLRTDLSDRDLNTDASLNLHLEESTVRSERMTPFKFSTAHIKGSMSARHLVVVPAAYPVDGRPATVQLVPLAAAAPYHPHRQELLAYPGPLVKGVTHKKSVIEYCRARAAGTGAGASLDPVGYVLLWELLALMLRQNGVVVGTDIAELLMRNAREHQHRCAQQENRGDSPALTEAQGAEPEQPVPPAESTAPDDESSSQSQPVAEALALDRLRELLIYGNKQEALEWAMNNKLWGHALQLAAHSERRVRAGVAARFLASVPREDPLHTLFATLAARLPPAVTCVAEERWGDWRPHAAIMLSNGGARPEHERRALTQLGDSLASRGLAYSAQFCYLSGGVPFARHPLAPLQHSAAPSTPPRLSLLLADPRAATLSQLATNQAVFATEIYEYALSLSQEDYVIEELQAYKLLAACRLVDIGECERALAYVERAARAVTSAPRSYPPALPARLAHLADRLKYYDPALQEDPPLVDEPEPDSAEPSPRHHQQWLDDVKNVANMLEAETWQHSALQQQQAYHDQTIQYQPPEQTQPEHEENPDYAAQYYQGQQGQFVHTQFVQQDMHYAQHDAQYAAPEQPQSEDRPEERQDGLREGEGSYAYGDDWPRAEEKAHTYADPYWQSDAHYSYGERAPAGLRQRRRAPAAPASLAPPAPSVQSQSPLPARAAIQYPGTPPTTKIVPKKTYTSTPKPKISDLDIQIANNPQLDGAGAAGGEVPPPSITLPGSAPSRPAPYDAYEEDRPDSVGDNRTERDADAARDAKKRDARGKEERGKAEGARGAGAGGGGGGGGWLGGILNKLSLRTPNQMILPDDKNPTIVWDAEHKRWRNLESDGEEAPRPPPPPPAAPRAPALSGPGGSGGRAGRRPARLQHLQDAERKTHKEVVRGRVQPERRGDAAPAPRRGGARRAAPRAAPRRRPARLLRARPGRRAAGWVLRPHADGRRRGVPQRHLAQRWERLRTLPARTRRAETQPFLNTYIQLDILFEYCFYLQSVMRRPKVGIDVHQTMGFTL